MAHTDLDKPPSPGLRRHLYEIIFEHGTSTGRAFDVALLWAIVISVLAVVLESVQHIEQQFGDELRYLEWAFTILFTIEYLLRLFCTQRPLRYVFSFFGVVDLLAVIPTYISLFLVGSQYLLVIRAIRLLRVFRILKMTRYIGEANVLIAALSASRPKITVFLGAVVSLVLIIGSLIHLIEGPEHGFTSIPRSVYWAIVTLTTVGYGDITPQTVPGQTLAAIVMIMGYGIIAVPTGIVSAELSKVSTDPADSMRTCEACGATAHQLDAAYCRHCGAEL